MHSYLVDTACIWCLEVALDQVEHLGQECHPCPECLGRRVLQEILETSAVRFLEETQRTVYMHTFGTRWSRWAFPIGLAITRS